MVSIQGIAMPKFRVNTFIFKLIGTIPDQYMPEIISLTLIPGCLPGYGKIQGESGRFLSFYTDTGYN
jgi:hypothetical protein